MFKTSILAIILLAGPALAMPATATPLQDQVVQAAFFVHRATVLCPQYTFKTEADYDRVMRGARKLMGNAAVDSQIQALSQAINEMIVSGGKETFCDQAVNLDATMSELTQPTQKETK
jgi:hypothetical protein